MPKTISVPVIKLLTPKQLLRQAREAQETIDEERLKSLLDEQIELEKTQTELMLAAALATPRGQITSGLAEAWVALETHSSRSAGAGPVVIELQNTDRHVRDRWDTDGNVELTVAVLDDKATELRKLGKQLKAISAELSEIEARQCSTAGASTESVVRSAFARNPTAMRALQELVEATTLAECKRRQEVLKS